MTPTVNFGALPEGNSLQRLKRYGYDPGALRPFMEVDPRTGWETGRSLMTVNRRNRFNGAIILGEDGKPIRDTVVTNAAATLRIEDWKYVDERVAMAPKTRLRIAADVAGANPFRLPNAYGTTKIEWAVGVGRATAQIGMDPIQRGNRSRRILETYVLPVPCIWSDGEFSSRENAITANNPTMRLDTSGVEEAARIVAETVENLYAGLTSYSAYGGTITGLRNTTGRFTTTLTAPTGSNGPTVVGEVALMVKVLKDNFFYGPYVAYYSTAYDPYFALDYRSQYSRTLGQRMREAVPDVSVWRAADFFGTTAYNLVIVQLTPDVMDAVLGQDLTTVQWDGEGGFASYFKVWTINNPRVRLNGYGKTGINDGAVP